jgi:hypothetical protein
MKRSTWAMTWSDCSHARGIARLVLYSPLENEGVEYIFGIPR